jgi:hypothetical protein
VVADSPFINDYIKGIAYGGPADSPKFVAVGSGGMTAYSADGITWDTVSESKFGGSTINAVVWGGPPGSQKFVAVGDTGKIAYSPDGVTWTPIPAGTTDGSTSTFPSSYNGDILSIAWGGGKFIAGGSGHMAYSVDGVSWTTVTTFYPSTVSSYNINGIAYGGGYFVAVGRNDQISYSQDGISWTAVNNTYNPFADYINDDIESIVYGNGKFLIAGLVKIAEGMYAPAIAVSSYSPTGGPSPVGWTLTEGRGFSGPFAYNGEKFISPARYSTDGRSWKAMGNIPHLIGMGSITAIVWGNGKFLAGSESGKLAYWDGQE